MANGTSRPTLLEALSCMTLPSIPRMLQNEGARKKRELDDLRACLDKLEREARATENEEEIWRFLYFKVTNDAEEVCIEDWPEPKRKDVMLELLRTHGAVPGIRQVKCPDAKYVQAFSTLFRDFKEQQFQKGLLRKSSVEYLTTLLEGAWKMEEEASKCREALNEFKSSDGYRRLRRHDNLVELLVYRKLLAQLRSDKEGEREVLNGISTFERSEIKDKSRRLWEEKVQPFRFLSEHLNAMTKKKNGRKLGEATLKVKISELEGKIRELERQTDQTEVSQTQN